MEPFFIEADIFNDEKPVQMFIIPQLVDNETNTIFKIDYQDTKLGTLAMSLETLKWYAMDGDLDENTVELIGAKIDNYFFGF